MLQPNSASPCRNASRRGPEICIVCGCGEEYADAPHLDRLLRLRRERPYDCRTAEPRNELPLSHQPSPLEGRQLTAIKRACERTTNTDTSEPSPLPNPVLTAPGTANPNAGHRSNPALQRLNNQTFPAAQPGAVAPILCNPTPTQHGYDVGHHRMETDFDQWNSIKKATDAITNPRACIFAKASGGYDSAKAHLSERRLTQRN
jgi:hypothetical protein